STDGSADPHSGPPASRSISLVPGSTETRYSHERTQTFPSGDQDGSGQKAPSQSEPSHGSGRGSLQRAETDPEPGLALRLRPDLRDLYWRCGDLTGSHGRLRDHGNSGPPRQAPGPSYPKTPSRRVEP